MKSAISMHNAALEPLIFRIRPSTAELFVMSQAEGIIVEDEKITIDIALKKVPHDIAFAKSKATVYVDVMEYDDSYETMGAYEYWTAYSSNCISKCLVVEVQKAIQTEVDNIVQSKNHGENPLAFSDYLTSPKVISNSTTGRAGTFRNIRDAEKVEIFPLCLKFIEGEGRLVDTILLNNTSDSPISYRIRVSAPNMFVLKTPEGVVDPSQKLSIPVVLKSFPTGKIDPDVPLAKFAVEFLECNDEYYISGSKDYWKEFSDKTIRRTVLSKAVEAHFSSTVLATTTGTRRGSYSSGTRAEIPLQRSHCSPTSSENYFARRRSSMGGPNPTNSQRLSQVKTAVGPPEKRGGYGISSSVVVLPLCLKFVGKNAPTVCYVVYLWLIYFNILCFFCRRK